MKVSVFADDMSVFLVSEGCLSRISSILEAFEGATGARVNKNKSGVLHLGRWAGRRNLGGDFSLALDGLKILGVKFSGGGGRHAFQLGHKGR